MNSEIKNQGFPGHVVSVTGASEIADLWTVQILDPAAEHHAFAWRTFEANLSLDYALKRGKELCLRKYGEHATAEQRNTIRIINQENNYIIRITEDGA